MESFIEIKNLTYKYHENDDKSPAVDSVSLSIKKGEFVAIIGHNGSGKSTLAKHFNAILLPNDGDVIIDGMNTKEEDKLFDIRQKVGLVFQNPDNQIIATIVEDDVAFGPENLGVEPLLIRNRVDKALETVGMLEFSKKEPHNLSGGQKQRVAIAGVLAMEPECIVFDESTAMLDPSGRKEVMDTAIKLNKESNITIIIITHFMQEAILADKIYVMDNGKIVSQGTPKEIFSSEENIEKYSIEIPPMKNLAKKLVNSGIKINENILTVEEMAEELCKLK